MRFIGARNFSKGNRAPGPGGAITGIVLHTAEAPEGPQTAENVAAWGAGPNAPQASWHYMIDSDSIVQSVHEKDVAWHAGPVNGWTIGVEHAGYAKQSAEAWRDPYSLAMLERSAELVADICRRYDIPVRKLEANDLAAGERRGIFGHVDVTMGLTAGRGHYDPGAHFIWDWYLDRVRHYLGASIAFDAAVLVPPPPEAPAPPDFSTFVRVEHAGQGWLVSPIVYGPISIGDARRVAAATGCELPTPGLADAIWRAADLRVSPATTIQTHDGTHEGMNAPEVYARVFKAIERAVNGRSLGTDFRLIAGAFKDVVEHNGKVGLYGMHVEDEAEFRATLKARLGVSVPLHTPATSGIGKVVQPPYYGHSLSWKDYAQGVRLVRRA